MGRINWRILSIGIIVWIIALYFFLYPTINDMEHRWAVISVAMFLTFPFIIQPMQGKKLTFILNQNLDEQSIGYDKKNSSQVTQYMLIFLILISTVIGLVLYYIRPSVGMSAFLTYPFGVGLILYGIYIILKREAFYRSVWLRGISAVFFGIGSIILGFYLLYLLGAFY